MKTSNLSADNFKKVLDLDGSTPEPAIRSGDTGQRIIDTTTLLDKVGFIVHPEKSVLLPTQRMTLLGFVFDSILMQVSLTLERAFKLRNACENLLATASPCIRDVAQVLGLMTSSFPGAIYGPLHHKSLEMDKTKL